jgi:hypothetical protein
MFQKGGVLSTFVYGRWLVVRQICLIALLFSLSGCGADFFPAFKRPPIQPDPFSFTTQNGVAVGVPVTSNAITVSGITGTTSPISITGPVGSNSTFSINGTTVTDAAPTVKNGDTVKVTQTSSASLGATTVSTLTIGNITGTFTTVTQTVQTPAFTLLTPQPAGFSESSALISANDSLAHVISITGANAQFAVSDANLTSVSFTSPAQVFILNGQRIVLRIPTPATGTTTLTIDSTNFQIDVNTLAVVASPK